MKGYKKLAAFEVKAILKKNEPGVKVFRADFPFTCGKLSLKAARKFTKNGHTLFIQASNGGFYH